MCFVLYACSFCFSFIYTHISVAFTLVAVDFILRCAHSWIPSALYSFDGHVPSQWSYSHVTPLVADSRVAVEALLTLSAPLVSRRLRYFVAHSWGAIYTFSDVM